MHLTWLIPPPRPSFLIAFFCGFVVGGTGNGWLIAGYLIGGVSSIVFDILRGIGKARLTNPTTNPSIAMKPVLLLIFFGHLLAMILALVVAEMWRLGDQVMLQVESMSTRKQEAAIREWEEYRRHEYPENDK